MNLFLSIFLYHNFLNVLLINHILWNYLLDIRIDKIKFLCLFLSWLVFIGNN